MRTTTGVRTSATVCSKRKIHAQYHFMPVNVKRCTNSDHASKDSGDSSFRRVALLKSGGLRLSVGLVDGADELVDERCSLGGALRVVRSNAL